MMVVRTIVSAITIVLGALLIVTWAASNAAVDVVEDGSAMVNVTLVALDSPAALGGVSEELGNAAVDALSGAPIDIGAFGIEGAIRDQVSELVASEAFVDEVERQLRESQQQFADALTDDDREPGPLVIMMDASPLVNARVNEIPVVGSLVPELTLAPIPVEVWSAESAESARTAYGMTDFAATWFLWIGLALIGVGALISGRRRWFLAKTLLAIGVLSLGVWALLTYATPETIVGWFAGDSDDAVESIVVQAFAAELAPSIARRMMWWGVTALVGSAISALVAASIKSKKE